MKNWNASNQTTRRILPAASATALAVTLAVSLAQPGSAAAYGDQVTPPPVPTKLEVPEGNIAFLVGHAIGTQNYVCVPSGSGFAWNLFTPQATLFDDHGRQIITHFFSPNPFENLTIRATWQHSRDTSTVWAAVVPDGSSSDPIFVAPGAVPWLLLKSARPEDEADSRDLGRSRRGVLTATTYVQRLNTSGGIAPSTGCSLSADVGKKAFVPYTADYFFYEAEDDAYGGN
jgi:hypothetical protein